MPGFRLLALPPAARARAHARRSHLLVRGRRRRRPTSTGRRASPRRRSTRTTRPEHPRRVALELVRARGEEGADRLCILHLQYVLERDQDRKRTRLNSSHVENSYAVFCLKKNSEPTAPRISDRDVTGNSPTADGAPNS